MVTLQDVVGNPSTTSRFALEPESNPPIVIIVPNDAEHSTPAHVHVSQKISLLRTGKIGLREALLLE